MASGSFTSSTGLSINLKVVWSSTGNSSNNTSTVKVSLYLESFDLYVSANHATTITIDGVSSNGYAPAISHADWGSILIASYTRTVNHNADGTKSLNIYGAYNGTGIVYAGKSLGTISCSRTVTLDKLTVAPDIPTAPTSISVSGQYEVGNNISVSWSGAGGTITSYDVEYAQYVPGTGWKDWYTAAGYSSGTSMSHNIVSVGATKLKYRVRARNSSGVSAYSPESAEIFHYGLKVWNGSSLIWGRIKVYNGTTWTQGIIKVWDGTSWVIAN